MPTRFVSFAGQTVAVEHPETVTGLVQILFRDTNDEPARTPGAVLTITQNGEEFSLHHGGQSRYSGQDQSVLATILINETIHHLISNNTDGMALHAAALSKNGKGVVLPGPSGSGKTTLSTWLTAAGFNYMTDEYVFIPSGTRAIHAFTRPPNVKPKGLPTLNDYFDMSGHEQQTIQGKHIAMIPPHLLNPESTLEDATVDLIIFPRYREGSEFALEKVTKAKAGLALMESLVNARNLDGHGFGEATRLVRDIPSYRLTYSSLQQLQQEFKDILPS